MKKSPAHFTILMIYKITFYEQNVYLDNFAEKKIKFDKKN